MIDMKLGKLGRTFFNHKKVIAATDKATRTVLSRFGAFVRRTARSSIRRRKKAAPPGKPPSSHTGLLKKFIFFGYDASRKSVVIGPAKLSGKSDSIPRTLEMGGRSVTEVSKKGKSRKKKVAIAARPYMGPAFEKEKPQLPALWRDSIRSR